MAGQDPRGVRGHGRSSRRGSSARTRGAAFEAVPGTASTAPSTTIDPPAATTADLPIRTTLSAYRLLLMRGLSPDEAANLTAWTQGIPTTDLRWSLGQVNILLFLRALQRTGRFGADDGGRRLH